MKDSKKLNAYKSLFLREKELNKQRAELELEKKDLVLDSLRRIATSSRQILDKDGRMRYSTALEKQALLGTDCWVLWDIDKCELLTDRIRITPGSSHYPSLAISFLTGPKREVDISLQVLCEPDSKFLKRVKDKRNIYIREFQSKRLNTQEEIRETKRKIRALQTHIVQLEKAVGISERSLETAIREVLEESGDDE